MILDLINGALVGFIIGVAFVRLTSVRHWREAAEAWEHVATAGDEPPAPKLRAVPRWKP